MNVKVLKNVLKGDKDAFAKLYDEFFTPLWRYVYARTSSRSVTSDIVSDSFTSLYENRKSIKYAKAVKNYLYKIARNKIFQYYKREKTIQLSEFETDRLEKPERSKKENSKEVLKNVEKVLKNLPENYSEVLRLRFISGLKIREVAELLDKTESNIKVIQHRAVKKAQKLFSDEFNFKTK